MSAPTARARVAIVGAGFAGLAAARALQSSPAEVVLIDQNIYSTFQPLLYQVATGGLNPGDISYPIRSFARGDPVRFLRAKVARVDIETRALAFADGGHLDYDYLILASGSHANFFGVPGAERHACPLYRRTEAIAMRDRLLAGLEHTARFGGGLSICVIGAGPTGVEMAGTLAELRDAGLRALYPDVDPQSVRVVLVEQGPDLLSAFAPDLQNYTLQELRRRRVEILTRTSVSEVQDGRVVFSDGRFLDASLTVWAAGVTVECFGLPAGHGGRVLVDRYLRVLGCDNVFAAGDVALNDDQPVAQLAQPALQAGAHAGAQLQRLLSGRPLRAFHYRERGTMATVGRRAAIVQLPYHVHVTGTTAWLAWLALHIARLLGGRNRASALLNLAWRYLSWPAAGGVIVGDLPEDGD